MYNYTDIVCGAHYSVISSPMPSKGGFTIQRRALHHDAYICGAVWRESQCLNRTQIYSRLFLHHYAKRHDSTFAHYSQLAPLCIELRRKACIVLWIHRKVSMCNIEEPWVDLETKLHVHVRSWHQIWIEYYYFYCVLHTPNERWPGHLWSIQCQLHCICGRANLPPIGAQTHKFC